jgi:hypothetical protein
MLYVFQRAILAKLAIVRGLWKDLHTLQQLPLFPEVGTVAPRKSRGELWIGLLQTTDSKGA